MTLRKVKCQKLYVISPLHLECSLVLKISAFLHLHFQGVKDVKLIRISDLTFPRDQSKYQLRFNHQKNVRSGKDFSLLTLIVRFF